MWPINYTKFQINITPKPTKATEDEGEVKPEQVKGVLFPPLPAPTPRLKRFVRFPHSLVLYNIK